MLTLNDGRSELWQWDTGRKLTVDADCSQVHFSNKVFGRSIDVDVIDGVAIIPDILLQTDKELNAWAFVGTAENGYTKISKTFKVNRRNKPSDYVFTPPEQTYLEEIKKEIEYLKSIQDPDAIKNAVDDYLANNPIQIDEKDPTVPAWAKQATKPKYTATEVGAVATVNGVRPDASGNVQIAVSGGSGVAASSVEPAEDDIPKVFFDGDISGMSKDDSKDISISYRSKSLSFDGMVEMKWQGSSSVRYPKKNFTVKMFTDSTKGEKLKKDFRGWGAQNKFCLKANYIDHSHARNIVSARLWDEVVESRPDYDALPEEMRSAPNNGAIDGFPIKLYINGNYEGIYTWNIPKDGWMFNMTEDNPNHCVLCGANNSFNGRPTPTSCQFRTPYNSADWKTEFPDVLSQDMIDKFNRIITFVTTSTDEEFKAHLGDYVDVQSAIDYRVFADVIAHHDGLGNNMIFLTYDGVVWFFSMYDMDSTHGLWWDGSQFVATSLAFPSGFQEPENLMWERIDKCFFEEVKARYAELRKSVLSLPNMVTHFERFVDVIGNDLYAEDLAIYTGIPSGSTNNIKQLRNYIRDRLAFVDAEIAGLSGEIPEQPDNPEPSDVPCVGIALSANELTFNGESTQTITATVMPSNTTDSVVWVSSEPYVASISVDGNICTIQSRRNGNAVITATCGDYSASCVVSVSGFADEGAYLAHSFEGANATSAKWVDSVDPSYQFDFTGSPVVENGIVKFSTGSYGVLNKNVGISNSDATLVLRCSADPTKEETWIVGTPQWSSGVIVGKKSGRISAESGINKTIVRYPHACDGSIHTIVARYVHSESAASIYVDGALIGALTGADLGSWLSSAIYLNNEGADFRGSNSVEFVKIYDGALSDDEIINMSATLVATDTAEPGYAFTISGDNIGDVTQTDDGASRVCDTYIHITESGKYYVQVQSIKNAWVFAYDAEHKCVGVLAQSVEPPCTFVVDSECYIRVGCSTTTTGSIDFGVYKLH